MIDYTILLFGGLKQYYAGQYQMQLPAGATGQAVIDQLLAINPEGAGLLSHCIMAVDAVRASKDEVLNESGREIAFLPPFSGG
jgi:molybdopterin converting factor small subunit